MKELTFVKLFKVIENDHFLTGFNQWKLADRDKWSVDYEATRNNDLPENFNQWKLCDKNGHIAAHEAAASIGFDWMNIIDNEYVDHDQILNQQLPASFNQWELCDKNGHIAAHEATANNSPPIGLYIYECKYITFYITWYKMESRSSV